MAGEVNPNGSTSARARRLSPWSWPLLASGLAWLVIFAAIPPSAQDFPLGDDWAFARGAIWFAQGEGIHYSRWASMPELGQWLWSFPFLKLISLEQVALRISSIVLGMLGVLAFYDLLRQAKIPAERAGLAACVLALNPLFFISQGTYMTDVPTLALALIALDFYVRAMNGGGRSWLLAGMVMASLAGITRQTMLAVPVAVVIAMLAKPELRRQMAWWLAVLVPAVACVVTYQWFSRRPDISAMSPRLTVEALTVRPFVILHLCGLVVLPLCFFFSFAKYRKTFCIALMLVLAVAAVLPVVAELPYGGLFPYCVGMLSLCGTYTEGLVPGHRDFLLGPATRVVLSWLGCFGAACLLTAVVEEIRARKWPGVLMLFSALTLGLSLIMPATADRYYEVLFPAAIGLMAMQWVESPLRRMAGGALVVVAGLVAVGLYHDWLSWNSARWELGWRFVLEKHIAPQEIEGGFEWNGWYATMDPKQPLPAPDYSRGQEKGGSLAMPFTRVYFPAVAGRYALAYTPPPHTVVLESQAYPQWMLLGEREFVLVEGRP